jgi:hypothetical protein
MCRLFWLARTANVNPARQSGVLRLKTIGTDMNPQAGARLEAQGQSELDDGCSSGGSPALQEHPHSEKTSCASTHGALGDGGV